jgi:hypothetical protein
MQGILRASIFTGYQFMTDKLLNIEHEKTRQTVEALARATTFHTYRQTDSIPNITVSYSGGQNV